MSTADSTAEAIPARIRREAAEWLVELQSAQADEALRQKWQAWRAAHPDHERAWQRVEQFGQKLRDLPADLAHAILASGASPPRRRFIKTLGMAALAGGITWMAADTRTWRHLRADRRTGTGERLRLPLPDGTQVQMNTGTAIDIHFTPGQRLLRLLDGEILVETAPHPTTDSDSDFIVETAQGRLRALGTRFCVRDLTGDPRGSSRIAVYEGAVELHPQAPAATRLLLQAGEQGNLTRTTAITTGAASEDDIAWIDGMLVAQNMPLLDFTAELARHRHGRLDCDPAVAHLTISGTYPLANTDRVLRMLAATLPVRLRVRSRYWVTIQPA